MGDLSARRHLGSAARARDWDLLLQRGLRDASPVWVRAGGSGGACGCRVQLPRPPLVSSRSPLSGCSTEISAPPSKERESWQNLEENLNFVKDLQPRWVFQLPPRRAGRRALPRRPRAPCGCSALGVQPKWEPSSGSPEVGFRLQSPWRPPGPAAPPGPTRTPRPPHAWRVPCGNLGLPLPFPSPPHWNPAFGIKNTAGYF